MIGILNFSVQATVNPRNEDNSFKTIHLNEIIIQNKLNTLEKCNFYCDQPLKIK